LFADWTHADIHWQGTHFNDIYGEEDCHGSWWMVWGSC